jgi:hypothetical protein
MDLLVLVVPLWRHGEKRLRLVLKILEHLVVEVQTLGLEQQRH